MAEVEQAQVADDEFSSVLLTDRISLGVLAEVLPRDVIDDVLVETGRRERRTRSLPAHVMVRFCLAMCLFYGDDYEEVMRKLAGALVSMGSWQREWRIPSTSAITQARQRLGFEPLRELFDRVAEPVAGPGTRGAWLRSWRLMAMDGFMLSIPDTPENDAEFGRKNNGTKSSAFPQVLTVALGECGSHAIVGAALGGCNSDERALAGQLRGAVEPDMLVIADRNFYSFELWSAFRETGADLLWRVNSTLSLPVLRWLPDGSHLSVVCHPAIRGQRRERLYHDAQNGVPLDAEEGHLVRVVEYDVPNREGSGSGEIICVITSILHPAEATGPELATAYHERWECENLIGEIKTHQKGPTQVLRSKSPDMVRQEIWALLLTHYAVRRLMCNAADEIDIDPDRLSFIRSLRVIRRHVEWQAEFSP